ncbi:esterase/lipase family protein [Nocardiaceae bacterium NPDC056970]
MRRVFAGVALGFFLLVCASGPASAQEDRPVSYNFLDGIPLEMGNPGGSAPGSNDRTCKPSADHPNPVVLVHGTGGNRQNNWGAYAALSANEDYCVFASTHGTFGYRSRPISAMGGMMPIGQSAEQLRDFVVDKYVSPVPLWNGTNAFDVHAPQATYTNMMTRYDELIVPHTSGLLEAPNATDIVVQDGCAANFGEHAAIAAEPVAAAYVMNAWDRNRPRPAPCVFVAPIAGG